MVDSDHSAMNLSLSKRLRFADRSVDGRSDRGVMARVLMYAFAAGALVAALSFSLAGGVAAGVCLIASAVLLIGYDDLPRWAFPPLVGVATALGLAGVYAGGTSY